MLYVDLMKYLAENEAGVRELTWDSDADIGGQ